MNFGAQLQNVRVQAYFTTSINMLVELEIYEWDQNKSMILLNKPYHLTSLVMLGVARSCMIKFKKSLIFL
jgi:hypothetical protein